MKICYKYLPINLDKRWAYYPNHQIKVPALEWKAVVYDESNYPLKSPNTIYEYGFIDIIDTTVQSDVQDLISTLGIAVWMKEITAEEMRGALDENWYVHDGNYNYTIREEITWMGEENAPAVTLAII